MPAAEESTMKRPRRIAALLLAGFLAFAPPGTMIFLLALVAGFVGNRWAAGAVVLCAAAAAVLLLVRRRRARVLKTADRFGEETRMSD
jgi:membrane protein implicated in regulation of membrane protease activity